MSSSTPFPFRIPERRGSKPSDPENLFRSLSQRSSHIQHLWSHQADVLRSWHSSHIDTPDLALELPTGTGKTLIGLLIGDFVRQTRQERVAYLCPNRQLAHQVGRLADDYSIDARVLVGSQATYDPNDFSAFEDSSAVAVTTYSAVFNTNPRIDSANLLILDDAHASEDFIASLWNVEINRADERDLYFAILNFFKTVIPGSQLWNLKDESSLHSRAECGKIPSPIAHSRVAEFRDFLDSTLANSNLSFSWRMIRSHLDACHIFVTWPSISIRPITPPTFDHAPFCPIASKNIYVGDSRRRRRIGTDYWGSENPSATSTGRVAAGGHGPAIYHVPRAEPTLPNRENGRCHLGRNAHAFFSLGTQQAYCSVGERRTQWSVSESGYNFGP